MLSRDSFVSLEENIWWGVLSIKSILLDHDGMDQVSGELLKKRVNVAKHFLSF